MIVGDDLAKVEPEFLERGVAAGFSLKVGKADMPFWLVAAMFPRDFVETAFQRAAQTKVVIRDRDNGSDSIARMSQSDKTTSQ